MDARGVLVKPRRDLVLRLFYRYAVDVIDLLADGVMAEPMGTAGEREIVGGKVDVRAAVAERRREQGFRQARHVILRHRRCLIALAHYDPAHVLDHLAAVRLAAGRAHEDDTGFTA